MNYLRFFPFIVSSTLLVLAGVFHSAAFAATSVTSMAFILARDIVAEYYTAKQARATVPEDKKKVQDLEARITSIEMGIQRRGF